MEELKGQDWERINKIAVQLNLNNELELTRESFLRQLSKLITYDLGIFDLCKVKAGEFVKLQDPAILSSLPDKFIDQFISAYDNKYYKHSHTAWIYNEKKTIVFRETDLINEEMRKKSRYYTEYLEPAGMIYSCGCNIIYKEMNLGAVNLYRLKSSGDFSDKDLHILKQLQPHLSSNLSHHLDQICEKDISCLLQEEYSLTSREMEIIDYIYDGLSNKEISDTLSISINTVKKHINSLFFKIDVENRGQLHHFLNENGYRR